MRDYERYMYKLVYSLPQLSPTFSASQDAALPLTMHSTDQWAQNGKTGVQMTLISHSKDILF